MALRTNSVVDFGLCSYAIFAEFIFIETPSLPVGIQICCQFKLALACLEG